VIRAGSGNDLIFGDHGMVEGNVNAQLLPLATLTPEFSFTSIDTQNADDGGNDVIYAEDGDDIMLGGQGVDVMYGGTGDDDLIGGHNVAGGQDSGDRIDGGMDDDVIAGDNADVLRRGDALSPRIRVLSGDRIYGENTGDDGVAMVTGVAQLNPTGVEERIIVLLDHTDTTNPTLYGSDYIAGGIDDDVIFGQLGNDTIQGDGSIDLEVAAFRDTDGMLVVNASLESEGDGDDYIEGGGDTDLVFGNLGQDDIIGGSSNLFGQDTPEKRPDGSDLLFGGAGTDIARNDAGDESARGHARDADVILGDNGTILRLVGTGGVSDGAFLEFNYDQSSPFEDRGDLRIIPRAVNMLDYIFGGIDIDASAANDRGAADEIHGESGDDVVYSQVGNDVLFGEGQDDDLIGGYGHDWISGGTGEDGVLGDDGRIYTSRNSSYYGEPLYGISPLAGVNEQIRPNGPHDSTIINIDGQIKKTVNLTPFQLGSDRYYDPQAADDIIYGGLGNDFLHGGAGDDAISGAEALPVFYSVTFNPGDVLGFGSLDPEEFADYDENNPMGPIAGFLLNFDTGEGPATDTGLNTDGNDVLFGDLGNDWLVGGTGADHLWGGFGNDLLNADDDHTSPDGNTAEDVDDLSYADRVFGGAGRDYMIANTRGDQLYDWIGEFNSYVIPMSPFGPQTVNRGATPSVEKYLYDLSESDGADQTRAADVGTKASRNGEPEGEIGLVIQKDPEWGDQNGAPDDPQPGNKGGTSNNIKNTFEYTHRNNDTKDKKSSKKIAVNPNIASPEYDLFGVQPTSLQFTPVDGSDSLVSSGDRVKIDGFLLNFGSETEGNNGDALFGDLAIKQPHLFASRYSRNVRTDRMGGLYSDNPADRTADMQQPTLKLRLKKIVEGLHGWTANSQESSGEKNVIESEGFERLYQEEHNRRFLRWQDSEVINP
ncbi:calcium-binding protein, partial [Candidatus Latescibacterota bacterium]